MKETPSDAEVVSHKLMFRAGMIRKVATGIYTYLPLGLRALRKVEAIIREEMDGAGAQEILMPMIQPSNLWVESGRWDYYGKELLRLKDRNERDYCLGPTHEEIVTDLVRKEVRSYRDLPLVLYQIQTKFRDEIRPRFGVMRSREFIMKDAYSFDRDDASALESYEKMYQAYTRIFSRCGLEFKAVEADTGSIGGSASHEFMVLAETGEDLLLSCNQCAYAANMEKAASRLPEAGFLAEEKEFTIEKVHTPGRKHVEEVADFLEVRAGDLIKTMIFTTDKGLVAGLIRGNLEINPLKLKNIFGANFIELAGDEEVRKLTGAEVGYAGPMGLDIPIIVDKSVETMRDAICGANETDYHLRHVMIARDVPKGISGDIRLAKAGEYCPRCKHGVLEEFRGIEVGHIFKLGTKYSDALGAVFLDGNGKEQPCVMGCYGIGVGRTVAAAIEQNHDEHGIIFPVAIAPFQVEILPLQTKNPEVMACAQRLYDALRAKGLDVLLDNRDGRPGVKFKDADLIGIPCRVTIGRRYLSDGEVEIKDRKTGEVVEIPEAEALRKIEDKIKVLA
jgi:prolyl-tRNA synthetase